MLDLIRVGTPTLPESGDVFHFKQTLDHSLGGEEVFCQRNWGIQQIRNTRYIQYLYLIIFHTTLKRKILRVEPFSQTQILGICYEQTHFAFSHQVSSTRKMRMSSLRRWKTDTPTLIHTGQNICKPKYTNSIIRMKNCHRIKLQCKL